MLHDLKEKLHSGKPIVGTWLFLNDVGVAEIVAQSGFDFVMIDMEHSATGFENLRNLIMAVEHHSVPLVRVKANTPEFISAILDLGPGGIMVPRVNTVEQACFAVENAKYHPLGLRGFGPYRVSEYTRNMKQVLNEANERQLLWIQIEHRTAIENINEIVKVEGIDAFFIGPGDLSQSMGHLGGGNHPEVEKTMLQALKTIKDCGFPAGSAFGLPHELKKWYEKGLNIFTIGADFRFAIHGADYFINAFWNEMK